jgi:nickel-dependent lactate racemase
MLTRLAYGKTGLWINLPDDWNVTVVEPRYVPALPDPTAALFDALCQPMGAPPLREVVRSQDRVGIVFSDLTRPTPHHLILPAVLRELTMYPGEHHPVQRPARTGPTRRTSWRMIGELLDEYHLQNDA